jgi:SAM-dependent methyltransferase
MSDLVKTEEDRGSLFLSSAPEPALVSALQELVQHLKQAGYPATDILPLPGELPHLPLDISNLVRALAGRDNLFHKSALPWLYDAFARTRTRHGVKLHRAFHLCREISTLQAKDLLGATLFARLLETDILRATATGVRSNLMLTPSGDQIYASDPLHGKSHPEYVYLGRTSFVIAVVATSSTARDSKNANPSRLLDLGCGCGNIALALSNQFDEVVGTDIVDRCLTFSRLNATLAGATNCEFAFSDLYDNVNGAFDVIVANPPCGWVDPTIEKAQTFSTGGDAYGSELPQRVLAGAYERITEDGRIYTTLTTPVIDGQPYVSHLLEEIFGQHSVRATVYPVFEEYSYKRARLYRRHRVSKMVRYLVVIERRNGPFEIRFAPFDSLRLWSYRVRAAIPRLVASITGGPRG